MHKCVNILKIREESLLNNTEHNSREKIYVIRDAQIVSMRSSADDNIFLNLRGFLKPLQ